MIESCRRDLLNRYQDACPVVGASAALPGEAARASVS